MLEKIGLPAKPSKRGSAWVVDASHCQGCSSQFSFINRKHHCRRCGGIFCNSCTLQRMVLRGQGDAPVRICDPCKKLEDAARFELRFGRQKRTIKGSLKLEPKHEEEVSNQIPVTEENHHSSSVPGRQSAAETNIASSSKQTSEAATSESNEMESTSPEELRQKAAEEKNKYRILKGKGKPQEALQAFKRGKELERQAQALDITLRKSRKNSLALSSSANSQNKSNIGEGLLVNQDATRPSSGPIKDDLLSELRDLGWDDGDLHAGDQKRENLSLEGELSSIMREVLPKSGTAKGSTAIDNSQVLALKKKALMLKREGKLAEAKEELKNAKFLERELEEQELLAQAGDSSDDELSALVHSLDDHKQDDPLPDYGHDIAMNLDFLSLPNDLPFDDHLDVNDNDMNDPEMAAALKSFGWTEEDVPAPIFANRESIQSEITRLKKEALNQKRAGNMARAMELLRNAKQHEKALDTAESEPLSASVSRNQSKPQPIPEVNDEIVAETKDSELRPKPKSKFLIQRELLAVKKKALALRREGRVDEADEELNKGKDLERQLQEMENTQNQILAPKKTDDIKKIPNLSLLTEEDDVEAESEATDNDMDDPVMLAALKNLGWTEEDVAPVKITPKSTGQANMPKIHQSKAEIQRELLAIKRRALGLRREGKIQEADEELEKAKPLEEQIQAMEPKNIENIESVDPKTYKELESNIISKNKAIIEETRDQSVVTSPHDQRQDVGSQAGKMSAMNEIEENKVSTPQKIESLDDEIRARKRKAVALKREGKLAEAREELRQAKLMEKSLEEEKQSSPVDSGQTSGSTSSSPSISPAVQHVSSRDRFKLQQEVLSHKRLALKLKREGRIEESEAEFDLAKSLENKLEEMDNSKSLSSINGNDSKEDSPALDDLLDPHLVSALRSIGWDDSEIHGKVDASSAGKSEVKMVNSKAAKSERAELEERVNTEKCRALTLKRAGKQREALEALKLAKSLEKKLMSL